MLFGDERKGTPFLIPEGKILMYLCIIKMQIILTFHWLPIYSVYRNSLILYCGCLYDFFGISPVLSLLLSTMQITLVLTVHNVFGCFSVTVQR